MKVDENKGPIQLSQQRMIFLINKFLDVLYEGLKNKGKCYKLAIDNKQLSVNFARQTSAVDMTRFGEGMRYVKKECSVETP